jgi:hypothetical protein
VISPVLANLYLHYVLDLWVEAWRKKQVRGDVIIVRYADDAVLGFEHREDAEQFLEQLRERLAKFGLELAAPASATEPTEPLDLEALSRAARCRNSFRQY